MSDLKTFSAELDRAREEAVKKVVEVQKIIAVKCYQRIVVDSRNVGMQYGSPVWSGRYRASHTIAIGQPDLTVKPPHPNAKDVTWPDEPDGQYNAPAVSNATRVLNALKPFQVVYIANALPYAREIELGHSKLKAPEGVYEVTAESVKIEFKNINLKSLGL